MLDFLPVYKRELKAYLQSPSTWVVLGLFFFLTGFVYYSIMVEFDQFSQQAMTGGMFGQTREAPNVTEVVIRPIFNLMISVIMFIMWILTMRLVAEEKSKGTFELLVTCPIGDWSILIGKYLALLTVGVLMVGLAQSYTVLTWWMGLNSGSLPEGPIVITCAIGMLCLFATYAAFGLMASSFTDSQMTAAVITLIGLILWQIIGSIPLPGGPIVREIATELSAYTHTENFINGVLTVKDLAYFGLVSFLFLFVASKTLDARRWRV